MMCSLIQTKESTLYADLFSLDSTYTYLSRLVRDFCKTPRDYIHLGVQFLRGKQNPYTSWLLKKQPQLKLFSFAHSLVQVCSRPIHSAWLFYGFASRRRFALRLFLHHLFVFSSQASSIFSSRLSAFFYPRVLRIVFWLLLSNVAFYLLTELFLSSRWVDGHFDLLQPALVFLSTLAILIFSIEFPSIPTKKRNTMTNHILKNANIISLGGAGTLGRAIAERRKREGWKGKFTVYSTDSHKHDYMRRLYPDVQFVQGDIRNAETLYNAMVGHDVCLHLAAVKVIPDSEYWSLDTIDVNINGSINVCVQANAAGIQHVLGISTDKVCASANAYGATKYLMEKIFQEYSRTPTETKFHLVRYGNVLESTSSVLETWKKAVANGERIKITDPNMTRFWLSPQQAVDLVIASLELPSGQIYIPKMPALGILKLADYVLGEGWEPQAVPMRPGEKKNETLLTIEECEYAVDMGFHFILHPTTSGQKNPGHLIGKPYTSDTAEVLTEVELMELLKNET